MYPGDDVTEGRIYNAVSAATTLEMRGPLFLRRPIGVETAGGLLSGRLFIEVLPRSGNFRARYEVASAFGAFRAGCEGM